MLGVCVDLWHGLMVFEVDILSRFAPSSLYVCFSLLLIVPVPEVRVNLPCAHQKGWGEMIWVMHITSLCIHDYFLESIRPIWLIQVVALIKGLSVSPVSFLNPTCLSFSLDLISILLVPLSQTVLYSFPNSVLHLVEGDRSCPLSSTWLSLICKRRLKSGNGHPL